MLQRNLAQPLTPTVVSSVTAPATTPSPQESSTAGDVDVTSESMTMDDMKEELKVSIERLTAVSLTNFQVNATKL